MIRLANTNRASTFRYASGFYGADGRFVIESKDASGQYRRYCFDGANRRVPELFAPRQGAK